MDHLTGSSLFMKQYLASLILIYFTCALSAQNKRTSGINAEVFFSKNYQNESNLFFDLALARKQHIFVIGPRLTLSEKSNSEIGLHGAYRFFPNKTTATFDFFFQYQLEVVKQRLFYSSTDKGIAIFNTIGYGFNFHLTPDLYITNSIGAGIQKSWFEGGQNFIDPALVFNIGLGFRIRRFQKENDDEK